ncbi:hypothetical protein Vafri_8340, partial [Volvox africanus]
KSIGRRSDKEVELKSALNKESIIVRGYTTHRIGLHTSIQCLWCSITHPLMRIKVLFFAKSREVAGLSEQVFELENGANTEDLLQLIISRHPGIDGLMKTCVFAVNQEYVRPQDRELLKEGDEVAIIPPLSGG